MLKHAVDIGYVVLATLLRVDLPENVLAETIHVVTQEHLTLVTDPTFVNEVIANSLHVPVEMLRASNQRNLIDTCVLMYVVQKHL